MKRLLYIAFISIVLIFADSAIAQGYKYYNLDCFPVLGTLAPNATARYSRLPDEMKDSIRSDLWGLGLHSAGLAVRFRSNSSRLSAKWHSRNKFNMNHMTATGIRGLDLYVLQDSIWTTVSSARPSFNNHNSTSTIVTDMKPGVMREYMLYLSLYDGVDSLYIGVDSSAVVMPPVLNLPRVGKPIIMYGTSILQGGCATRPGMAHTNILQRQLQREVVNLGFSGNARLDPEIGRLMADSDASLYVLDMLPNCTADMLDERLENYVAILRNKHPETPILFVESPMFPISRFSTEVFETLTEKNARFRKIYERLVEAGDANIHYFRSEDILGDDYEATVDNYHFTDTGFQRFADSMLPVVKSLLKD